MMIRFSVLLALVLGPFLSSLIGGIVETLFGDEISLGRVKYSIQGVRLTLFLAAAVILLAGTIVRRIFKDLREVPPPPKPAKPSKSNKPRKNNPPKGK